MNDKIYTKEQTRDILHPVFRSHNVRCAVLFGSYSKGTAKPNSDVDILVNSGLRGLAFYGLLEDVVTTLDKLVDLLDTSEIIPGSPVEEEIRKSGVLIYGE